MRGCRWLLVILRGRDDAYWAGHYGCKFAGPELTFGCFPEREAGTPQA